MNAVSSIISRVGGREFLATRFRLGFKAVEQWEKRGSIPGRWHIPLMLLADERGVSLSKEELADVSKPPAEVRP